MKYEKNKMTMSDGNINVVHSWLPAGEPEAVVVLSHGMAEHAYRYDRFGRLLTSKKYALFAEDHRGHGETANIAKENGTGDFGFLADKNGFFRVVDDIHEEVLAARERYPGKKVFLFGHSFGSFVTQCYIEKYGDSLDGVIICGSAGPRLAMTRMAKVIGSIVKLFTGKRRVSKFMDSLAFGSYNAKIKPAATSVDWLSRDAGEVQKYIEDPWCGFMCTIGFFCDMFTGLNFIHRKKSMKMVPKDLPVLFIDGDADPVGDYSKSVTKLAWIYKKNGVKDVDVKFYVGARHELLNETNREEVEEDVLAWLGRH